MQSPRSHLSTTSGRPPVGDSARETPAGETRAGETRAGAARSDSGASDQRHSRRARPDEAHSVEAHSVEAHSAADPKESLDGRDTSSCRRCSTVGSGRFCTECGSPLNNAPCAGCGERLTPGSRYCHHCGAAAGAATGMLAVAGTGPETGAGTSGAGTSGAGTSGAGTTRGITPEAPGIPGAAGGRRGGSGGSGLGATLPWAVAGIAFLALFAMLAGKGFNARSGGTVDAPANALPNPAVDNAGNPTQNGVGDPAAAPFAAAAGGSIRAPDISRMSPSELADRLFNRIMILNDEGKRDSVQFFAPMAVQAYQMVEQSQGHPLDADQRYDVGRIAEVAGALPMARAQADTILQQQPDHLLGLLLAAQVARESGNTAAESEYASHFARVKQRELARKLPEYQRHAREIADGGGRPGANGTAAPRGAAVP